METAAPLTDRRVLAWHALELDIVPRDQFVAPEDHWPQFSEASLTLPQRHGMNNLALRFSCEMVAHFEQYVVDYLETRTSRLRGTLSDKAVARFATDERVHIQGFVRLLAALRPDVDAYRDGRLRFFQMGFWDRLVVKAAPAVTFFVATDLLEEMFLHLHTVMETQPEQSHPAARQVMALHASDEKSHLAMDDVVIRKRKKTMWSWLFALQAIASLLIMLVVDRKTQRAWKRAVHDHAAELALTPAQTKQLAKKRLSVSDIMGIRAFIARRREKPFPGSRLLCWALTQSLPRS